MRLRSAYVEAEALGVKCRCCGTDLVQFRHRPGTDLDKICFSALLFGLEDLQIHGGCRVAEMRSLEWGKLVSDSLSLPVYVCVCVCVWAQFLLFAK